MVGMQKQGVRHQSYRPTDMEKAVPKRLTYLCHHDFRYTALFTLTPPDSIHAATDEDRGTIDVNQNMVASDVAKPKGRQETALLSENRSSHGLVGIDRERSGSLWQSGGW